MSEAIILLWNPKLGRPKNLDEDLENLRDGYSSQFGDWSTAAAKNIPVGSRFFMFRKGLDPKGVFAAGWTNDEPWEEYPNQNWVEIEFTSMLDVDTGQEPISTEELLADPILGDIRWDKLQSNGKKLSVDQTRQLEALWKRHLKKYSLKEIDAEATDSEKNEPEAKAEKMMKGKTDPKKTSKEKSISKKDLREALISLVGEKRVVEAIVDGIIKHGSLTVDIDADDFEEQLKRCFKRMVFEEPED